MQTLPGSPFCQFHVPKSGGLSGGKIALLVLAVLLLIGIVAGVAGGGSSGSGSSSGGGGSSSDGGSEAPKKPDVTVTAAALVSAYEKNELSADEKFKDKRVQVSGIVSKIDTALLNDDDYILELGSGGEFEIFTVRCHGLSKGELAKMDTGQKVTVVGEFRDGGDLGVDLDDCSS